MIHERLDSILCALCASAVKNILESDRGLLDLIILYPLIRIIDIESRPKTAVFNPVLLEIVMGSV
jgi:hypothetical protein